MIDVRCIKETSVSAIKVGPESGRSAVILNPAKEECLKIKVDGCVVCDGPRADWVVERGTAAVIIELKGRNVEHGADQIIATAERWKNIEGRCKRFAGLIVGHQRPAASTAIQIKKNRFAKQFGGPLHVVNRNSEYEIEHLLSFRGPHKA